MSGHLVAAKGEPAARYIHIDAARGFAIVLMVIFHFTYDLNHFNYVEVDFNHDPFWLNFRTLIVTLFLCLVGISLQLATGKGVNLRRYGSRLMLLVAAAVAVTFGSYLVFPDKLILFGILHFIAVASVVGLLFRHFYWINLLLGIGLIIFGVQFQHEWFNALAWHWIGLTTQGPATVDYVPLLPWFGVVLIGMFLGSLIERYQLLSRVSQQSNGLTRSLALGGRHSLVIYLAHQPLLFAGFYLVSFFD
ncbi:hypothetical protein MNBD_GAMMA18-1269 [hydrothermal vent metagenome]|uniref:Heparan-alpha-glucosaminide N-acetyltransferase catalytic domain-containing protein n=1 Tax=hydrothermal vent metagenome TaxID=652676 RepID=A0A3B0ZKE3_9ZZZZ